MVPIVRRELRGGIGPTIWRAATVLEAVLMLSCARLIVLFCFGRFSRWMMQGQQPGQQIPSPALRRRIERAVDRAAAIVPWNSLCLPNAMAAKLMLARRGCASTIHLGVGINSEGLLHAHAWLEAGGTVVTGAGNIATVTPIVR